MPVDALEPIGHVTSPPARYTEASLVKKLEELGIGRPSTYASIMGALAARYVWKKGQALVPDWVSFIVVKLLSTALLAAGRLRLHRRDGGRPRRDRRPPARPRRLPQALLLRRPEAHRPERAGRRPRADRSGRPQRHPHRPGPQRRRDRGPGRPLRPVPEARRRHRAHPREAGPRRADGGRRPRRSSPRRAAAGCSAPIPATGLPVYAKSGRFGPYVQLGEAKEKEKPQKTQSLLKTMKLETVTLDDALQLLSLPRPLGPAPGGDEVRACYGKFGPYLTMGAESRNLGGDDDSVALTITLEQALAIFAQPKQFRGRGAPKPPLATFGEDAVSGKKMVLKEGKFGFYVTDGETNASLRRGDDPADLTPERAQELLAERREYMASPEGQQKMALRTARGGAGAGRGWRRRPGRRRQGAQGSKGGDGGEGDREGEGQTGERCGEARSRAKNASRRPKKAKAKRAPRRKRSSPARRRHATACDSQPAGAAGCARDGGRSRTPSWREPSRQDASRHSLRRPRSLRGPASWALRLGLRPSDYWRYLRTGLKRIRSRPAPRPRPAGAACRPRTPGSCRGRSSTASPPRPTGCGCRSGRGTSGRG